MVSKLSTSQFRYKVTKLILYDNYKRLKISKDFRFGKLFNLYKFPHILFSTTYKIFWTTIFQSYHLSAYILHIHPISATPIISTITRSFFAVPSVFVPARSFSDGICLPLPALLISRAHPLYFTALNRCHIWALRHNYISIQH